ncbi:MAG: VapC toxin family PIN domain ribonuclease [Candidatus Solibacter usitatus]|nr:VapC toxin family PIN domain ribonuclease [Candidatus Solibacter usitatus]
MLVALWWPAHAAHGVARRWFRDHGRGGWATCPMTQSGFVRTISNPSFSRDAATPEEAVAILQMNLAGPAHCFWPMDLPLAEALSLSGVKLRGHRQLTDLYLLGLAAKHGARLVTLDRALGGLNKDVILLG